MRSRAASGLEPFCQPDFATQLLSHGDLRPPVHGRPPCLRARRGDEGDHLPLPHPYDACKEACRPRGEARQPTTTSRSRSSRCATGSRWPRSARASLGADAIAKEGYARSSPLAAATWHGRARPGKVLDGRFEITDLVARSNMASIFKGTDRKTGQSVAIKVPLMALESDIAGYERFQREEEIGAKLNHHAILKVIKVEEEKSRPYLVMEFLAFLGKTLAEVLSKPGRCSSGGRGGRLREPDSATRWSTFTPTGSCTATSSRRTSWSAVHTDGSLEALPRPSASPGGSRRRAGSPSSASPRRFRHARLHLPGAGPRPGGATHRSDIYSLEAPSSTRW